MNKLEERAREMAGYLIHGYQEKLTHEDIARSMVKLAREFAADALRQVVSAHKHPNMHTFVTGAAIVRRNNLIGLGYATMKEAEEHREFSIAAAIKAAEQQE